jgi:hypothetical protein
MRKHILHSLSFLKLFQFTLQSVVFMTSSAMGSLLLCGSIFTSYLLGFPKAFHGTMFSLTPSHIFELIGQALLLLLPFLEPELASYLGPYVHI